MKLVITVAKKVVENKQIQGILTDEILVENVKEFTFDEAIQRITATLNTGEKDVIELFTGDESHLEQWFLADIKVLQIPLTIK